MNSQLHSKKNIQLGDYYWHVESRTMAHKNEGMSDKNITLTHKQHLLLTCLVNAHPTILNHKEIIQSVWLSKPTSSESLPQLISRTRNALQDKDKSILENVPGQGYKLNFTAIETSSLINDVDVDATPPTIDCNISKKSMYINRFFLISIGLLSFSALYFIGHFAEIIYYKQDFRSLIQIKPYPHIIKNTGDKTIKLTIDGNICTYDSDNQRLNCEKM
ncbi:winged helix-turn-helix domain-containing protein [Photobacterium japonica]|uniref:winged helix-turn-helix domain-containing protein n=1 Tax=Photobacterium japonica TaxID=2910235 RepID=UPI003D14B805